MPASAISMHPLQRVQSTRTSSTAVNHVAVPLVPSISITSSHGGPMSTAHPEEDVLLSPFSPEELSDRRDKLPGQIDASQCQDPVELPPAKLEFSTPKSPEGWTRCVHPEGAVYFHHVSKGILTRCDLLDDVNLSTIETFADFLQSDLEQILPMIANSTNVDLVLDVVLAGAECQYYFVDHQKKIVFWLSSYNPSPIFFNVKGVQADDHIRLALETQYWVHSELFPHSTLDISICDTLRDILVHSMSEVTLSDSALTPFTIQELQQMFDLTARIHASGERSMRGHVVYVIARMMRVFTRIKFINFHGQVGARLNADQSLYVKRPKDDCTPMSTFLCLLNFVLVGAPCSQFMRLSGLWIDHTINLPRWRNYIGMLNAEWNGITTYSTVMLAVNVSFLAVPGIIGQARYQIAVVAAIYLSTMFSVGSLVSAVLLTGKSRAQVTQSASEVASYMLKMAPSKARLEILAVMYSLPFAFVMWGILAFVVALGITVFSSYGFIFAIVMALFCVLVVGMAMSPVLLRRLSPNGRLAA